MANAQSILEILLRTKKEGDGDKQATQGMTNLKDAFKSATGVSLGWAGAAALAATAAVALARELGKAEQAAVESAKQDAKLDAVLKSTGGTVGMTKDELSDLASELSRITGLDDDFIKGGEAILLTFTGIGRETFPDTMKAAADLSVVLGTDLNGSVVQLGKAMNDFTGYTALKRAGVSFSAEQITQIERFKETNDLLGYQKLILAEVNKEFGGSAQAVNDAGDGTENMKVAVGNLQETIGAKLIPVQRWWNKLLEDTATDLNNAIIDSDEYKDSIERLGISYGPVAHGQQVVYTYMRNGVELTKEQVDVLLQQDRAMQAWGDSLTAQGNAYNKNNQILQMTEEEMQAVTQSSEEMIKQISAWSGLEEKYSTNMKDLTSQQFQLEYDLAQARKQGYSDTSTKVQDYLTELDQVNGKIEEVKRQHEIQTSTIILGYMQQKLAADGVLTDDETRWLIQKGEEWGVYSEGAVQAYEDASAAADDFLAHRNAAEGDRTVHVLYSVEGLPGYKPGPGSTAEARAGGGEVVANKPYVVGEVGPELFVPNQNGTIVPNSSLVNNSNSSITFNIYGSGDDQKVVDEVMRRLRLQGAAR